MRTSEDTEDLCDPSADSHYFPYSHYTPCSNYAPCCYFSNYAPCSLAGKSRRYPN